MSSLAEYTQFDALGLAELVARKEVHPRELVAAALERIERLNPTVNAVVYEMAASAFEAAEREVPDGLFAGVPYLLKDMVVHSGTLLTLGSSFLRDAHYIPQETHPVVERAEQAGLNILGKTNACEFGLLPTT